MSRRVVAADPDRVHVIEGNGRFTHRDVFSAALRLVRYLPDTRIEIR
jgi:hypothetical protein